MTGGDQGDKHKFVGYGRKNLSKAGKFGDTRISRTAEACFDAAKAAPPGKELHAYTATIPATI